MNLSIELQRDYWDAWNASNREQRLSDVSLDQRDMVLGWLAALDRTDLDLRVSQSATHSFRS